MGHEGSTWAVLEDGVGDRLVNTVGDGVWSRVGPTTGWGAMKTWCTRTRYPYTEC